MPILANAADRLRWPVYADPGMAGLCRSLTRGDLLSKQRLLDPVRVNGWTDPSRTLHLVVRSHFDDAGVVNRLQPLNPRPAAAWTLHRILSLCMCPLGGSRCTSCVDGLPMG